jgi:ubiquinone/menaquinone biosynthesis C-methylase UbiE
MWGTVYDLALRPFEAWGLAAVRRRLVGRADGRILEVGVGTGLNLPHYPPHARVTGVDPDPGMARRAPRKACAAAFQLVAGDAQALPFADACFDTAVATFVFCSIPDPGRAMGEVFRVLWPGGRLLLLEHVRARSRVVARVQDALTPAWRHVAGGCHLNRSPDPWIDGLPFERVAATPLWNGLGKLWELRKPEPSAGFSVGPA